MNTTKILGEAVGVQWQGVTDNTETNTVAGLTQAIVIGRFKRGNGLMTINQQNIKGMLGHEPKNPYYIAVQACLDAGVPSVKVLRVGANTLPSGISCDGATSRVELLNDSDYVRYVEITAIELDGITYNRTLDLNNHFGLPPGTISIIPERRKVYFNETDWNWFYFIEIKNLDAQNHRVKVIGYSGGLLEPNLQNDNPTINVTSEYAEFCLAPAADCTPSEPLQLLSAGNDPLIDSESGVKHDRVDYRLNGGDVQTFTASNEATTVWHVLDELQTELGMVAGTDGHWVFGNNAQGAAFTFGGSGNNPVTIFSAGKAGTDLDVPTTLELIFRDHQDDFVSYVIAWEDFKPMVGDNIGYSVILHACGVSEFA